MNMGFITYENYNTWRATVVKDFAVVTPDDNNDLPKQAIGFYCGVGGDITVTTPNGQDVTIPNLAAQTQYEFPCKRIKATGTTASNIVALYGE